jgi:putative membrane protein
MNISLVFSLLVALVAVVFAVQNAQPVRVTVFSWYFESYLVVILLLSFAAGVLAALLASIPGRVRKNSELREYRRREGQAQKQAAKSPPPPHQPTPPTP